MTSSNPSTARQELQHLHESDVSGAKIVVHPEDNDLFVVTGNNLIHTCRLQLSIELWMEELELAKDHVRAWCGRLPGQVSAAYLVAQSNRLDLFLVQKGDTHDFDLSDEVTKLDMDLNRNFNLGNIEPFQIPECEVERFVKLPGASKLHG